MRPISSRDTEWTRPGAPLDDAAMEQHVRSLAVRLNTDGLSAVRIPARSALRAPLSAAQSAAGENGDLPASLEWLLENGRMTEVFALTLLPDERPRLPASGGTARIQAISETLIRHSDCLIPPDRLIRCLIGFDEVRALTMDEIWAMPGALAASLCSEYIHIASAAVAAQKDRLSVLRWIEEGAPMTPSILRRSSAFFEYALRQLTEQGLNEKYGELSQWLMQNDRPVERIIAVEHERQAMDRLCLANLLTTLRTLASLDWSECFRRVCRTEITLLADPSGIYPKMDDESRARIRKRISYLSKVCSMGEATIAQCALDAASEGDGITRCVCWWLYTDAGMRSLLRRHHLNARIRPLIPDPNGRRYMLGVFALLAVFFLTTLYLCSLPAALVALPVLWGTAAAIVNRIIPTCVRPRPLLKLKLDRIPDEYRTLIAMPALLSSPERAEALVMELEALGCLEKDENISFLLLGDLPDHSEAQRDGDAAIILTAEGAIAEANRRAGCEKYYFLHRERVYQECEGRYMGRERKRGALNALNRLLLHGENAFAQSSAHILTGRYAFVITLDAGTRMLPGTAHTLIGALAHPLNRIHHDPDGKLRGYALLAPRMELAADAAVNRFIELYGGRGGVDSYPTAVSDAYQDLCGQGTFGGKGIYDVEAFSHALDGRLPDNLILSHDLAEGLLARAGSLCDVTLYDGHPRSFKAYLMRLNRWTRGDWQLLPLLLRRLPFSGLDRYRIVDNLRRSLEPAAQMLLLYLGFYSHSLPAVLLGLTPLLLPLLLYPRWTKDTWRRLLARLSLLPQETFALLTAVFRALWRTAVSHKHLLQWVTADDADRRGGSLSPAPSWIAAALLLPALAAPTPWLLTDVLLAALWWTGTTLTEALEEPFEDAPSIKPEDRRLLHELAARTFRFFTENTTSTGLPPDNVQLDPDNGAARRTSPTNIGLYLAACVSARELGIIPMEELAARAAETLASLEKMEKWHGQLYNWYHTDTLEPLRPRYVSSVDSGNLAACLLLTARSLDREGSHALAQRMESLVRRMDFSRLFDEKRKLFVIGMDVENDRLSASHYDLLASESRILSFTALMLGHIPASHWSHLGRMAVPAGGGEALTSWSGTMFEYLMPALFLPTCRGTLLHQTTEAVISAQIQSAVRTEEGVKPWGVSESGYYAFDLALNYQYRAFGLPELALRGDAAGEVIAPYASMLALPFAPEEVLENLKAMIRLGFMDEQGLFEAADCSRERIPEGRHMQLIRSHMAHHQGMILCAVCNALTDYALVRLFMDRPEARALTLLLQEKPASRIHLAQRESRESDSIQRPAPARLHRTGQSGQSVPDTHLLTGLDAAALLTADGSGFVRRGEYLLSRRESDPSMPEQGLFVHAHDRSNSEHFLLTGAKDAPEGVRLRVEFDAGSALYHTQTKRMDMQLRALISPEDGAFLQQIMLTNLTAAPIELDITACFQPVVAREADYSAHPAFQNLFLESSLVAKGALCFRRRKRAPGQIDPLLIHAVAGADDGSVSWETDLLRLIGRDRHMSRAGNLPDTLSNTLGPVLTPCSALRVRLNLPAHGRRNLCFAAGLVWEEEMSTFIERHASLTAGARALELAHTQTRELVRYLGLSPAMYCTLQRASALLLYPRLVEKTLTAPPAHDLTREALWPLGISGDLPILLAHADNRAATEPIRELIQAHAFYRATGVFCDLVLINEYESSYEQPVRDRLQTMISGSHLCGLSGVPGGVHLIDGCRLTEMQRTVLALSAAVSITGDGGSLPAQLRASLRAVHPRTPLTGLITPSDAFNRPQISAFNGFGGFSEEGYVITQTPAPAPWCNILCNRHMGSMVSERGGGFIWYRSSRNGRITPFDNDPANEGFGDVLLIRTADGQVYAPSMRAGQVTHRPGASIFEGRCPAFDWKEVQFVDSEMPVKCHRLTIRAKEQSTLCIQARLDFLMHVTRAEGRLTVHGFDRGMLWARGGGGFIAFALFSGHEARLTDGMLSIDLTLDAGETKELDLLIGAAENAGELRAIPVRWKDAGGGDTRLHETLTFWERRLSAISIHTPDALLNQTVNRWLPYQTLCGRIWGRTGFYQAGGAFGFRDQLQDMLALLLTDPALMRSHLILCAEHQFEAGDVQHWWHPERTGVRTYISDDMLFLPYAAAEYIETTGDRSILDVAIPFLKDHEIPEDQEDWYGVPDLSGESASFHEHCLRAIRRGVRLGKHGLLLMGAGDWNDGMNRVGHMGVGESVWLTEFAIVVLERYAQLCDESTKAEFHEIAGRLREAIELHGWDGRWYRRAYMDDGTILGGIETEGGCRIDSISQSWAVLAGLSRERVKTAMNEADRQLIDREHGIIRLLTPPFEGELPDPGYIRGYPPGVRENGGQYTHAACWLVIALAELGLADRAWEAFRMLLPYTHSDTEEKARTYRVEPYVMAADVYSEPPHEGRGGWTWYTGAAGWMLQAAYLHLMGFRKRGEYAVLNALLPAGWDEAGVTVRAGQAVYTLTARRDCGSPLLDGQPMPPEGIRLIDDGKEHFAVFPPAAR